MKDMMGAAFLGELMARLSRSDVLRQALNGMSPGDAENVIGRIVREAERLAAASGEVPSAQKVVASPLAQSGHVGPAPASGPPASPPVRSSAPTEPVAPAPARPAPASGMASSPGPSHSTQPFSTNVQAPPAAAPAASSATVPSPSAPSPSVPSPAVSSAAASSAAVPPAAVPPASAPPAVMSSPAATASVASSPAVPPVVASSPAMSSASPPHAISGSPGISKPVPEKQSQAGQAASSSIRVPEPPRQSQEKDRATSPPSSPAAQTTAGARTGISAAFSHAPFPFQDERAYMIAASLIPMNDSPCPHPFHVGGPGLDPDSELFAVDHAGMRFYLSLLNKQDASVSKSGMLLLGKQDALIHRGNHERLINTLRLRGMILPAESGTVVRGREDLVQRIDFRLHALLEILLGLTTTTAWHLQVSVLDSRVQQTLPTEAAQQRTGRQEREGGRGSGSQKRTDIKALDRLLTREKKLAEAILHTVAGAADRHDVDYMITLAGGSSDGWKVILKATFHLPQSRFARFAETVVGCQEMHAVIGPMFVLAGGTESFSLSM